MSEEKIIIHTDGACSGNPGPGGWAAVVQHGALTREVSGGFAKTTNNRMELHAVISALEILEVSDAAVVHSDSRYVVDMIMKGHAERWRQNGWMRDRKHLAQNSDLWERLLTLCTERDIEFVWVKGHDGHEINERVDQLAVAACAGAELPPDDGFINPPLFPSDGLFA